MHEAHRSALLFWESARLPFNLLIVLVVAWMLAPISSIEGHSASSYIFSDWLFAWFVIANVLYSLLHPIDYFARRNIRGELVIWRCTVWMFSATVIGALTNELMSVKIGAAIF